MEVIVRYNRGLSYLYRNRSKKNKWSQNLNLWMKGTNLSSNKFNLHLSLVEKFSGWRWDKKGSYKYLRFFSLIMSLLYLCKKFRCSVFYTFKNNNKFSTTFLRRADYTFKSSKFSQKFDYKFKILVNRLFDLRRISWTEKSRWSLKVLPKTLYLKNDGEQKLSEFKPRKDSTTFVKR